MGWVLCWWGRGSGLGAVVGGGGVVGWVLCRWGRGSGLGAVLVGEG